MFIKTVMFSYISKSDVLTLRKDMVCTLLSRFSLGGLVRMLKYLELSKFDNLTLGKNLTCSLGSIVVSRSST